MSTPEAYTAWNEMRALVLDNDRRKQACDALGLSFVRIKALRLVAERPSTLREIAAQLFIDSPYATLVVRDLHSRGLVDRLPHPTDRRAKLVTGTDAGRQLASRADAILGEPPAALAALPADQLRELARTVSAVRSATGTRRT